MSAFCLVCGKPIAGLVALPLTPPLNIVATLYLIHLIDEHWPMVEQIRSTTGDAAARGDLVRRWASSGVN